VYLVKKIMNELNESNLYPSKYERAVVIAGAGIPFITARADVFLHPV
jgi:hypothetical protein